MIIRREFFVANPGQASKLAAILKVAATVAPGKSRVMMDVTGRFNPGHHGNGSGRSCGWFKR
jgi:hypothetical protein